MRHLVPRAAYGGWPRNAPAGAARPLTTPPGDPEGPRRRASPARWCCKSCLHTANGCGFAPYIPKGELGRTAVEDESNGGDFTPHGRTVAPACGIGLLCLLGRQGSGGFLPLWGGPPARFGDFPAVESHAGVRGRSAPKLPTDTLRRKPAAGGSWAEMAQRPKAARRHASV